MDASVPARWNALLDDVADYLQFMKEEGQKQIEGASDILQAKRSGIVPPRGGESTVTLGRASSPSEPPPPLPASEAKGDGLDAIAQQVAACRLCGLCETRNQTVPGQGNPRPELIFVGEGPGADEDAQGLAFVGRAGQLLTKMIEAMGLTRDEVWIGNIVKCRPPNNRVPTPEEMASCMPYLKQQIALLQPKVMVCLGATAVKGLLDTKIGITKLRGQWMEFEGIATMPTYHPAYLLRNPPAKKFVWEDLKAVLARLGRTVPTAG